MTFVERFIMCAIRRSDWHVLTRDHTVLPATHTFM